MTPDDSVAPVSPGVSDNPRRGLAGLVSFVNWFREIRDWITGLSPSGSTVYDTGFITSGLSFTVTQAIVTGYVCRRRGKTAFVRVNFNYTGPTVTGGPDGNVLDQEVLTLPSGWRPYHPTYDFYVGAPSLYRIGGQIDASGKFVISDAPPGVTIESGVPLQINARLELP